MTAPEDNRNALQHGMFSERRYSLSTLPKPFSGAARTANEFRRDVEQAAMATHGEISTATAKLIQTATVAFRQALCCGVVLRECGKPGDGRPLSHEQWIAYSDRLIRYSESADRALKALKVDVSAPDPWALIDVRPTPTHNAQNAPQRDAASERDTNHVSDARKPSDAK